MGCQEFNDLETPKLSKKQLCDRAGPERLAQRACSPPAPPRGACPAPARSDLADNPQHPDPAPTVTREDLQAMRVLLEVLVDQLPPQLTSRRCSDPRESEGRTGALRAPPWPSAMTTGNGKGLSCEMIRLSQSERYHAPRLLPQRRTETTASRRSAGAGVSISWPGVASLARPAESVSNVWHVFCSLPSVAVRWACLVP